MFDLKNSDFCFVLSSLYELISGYLKILLGLEYPILLVVSPFFLPDYYLYYPIIEELTHDPKVMDISWKSSKVSRSLILLLDQ